MTSCPYKMSVHYILPPRPGDCNPAQRSDYCPREVEIQALKGQIALLQSSERIFLIKGGIAAVDELLQRIDNTDLAGHLVGYRDELQEQFEQLYADPDRPYDLERKKPPGEPDDGIFGDEKPDETDEPDVLQTPDTLEDMYTLLGPGWITAKVSRDVARLEERFTRLEEKVEELLQSRSR